MIACDIADVMTVVLIDSGVLCYLQGGRGGPRVHMMRKRGSRHLIFTVCSLVVVERSSNAACFLATTLSVNERGQQTNLPVVVSSLVWWN